ATHTVTGRPAECSTRHETATGASSTPEAGSSRSTVTRFGETAASRSTSTATSSTPSTSHSAPGRPTTSTTTTETATSAARRRVGTGKVTTSGARGSAGDGDGGEHAVEDAVGGDALQLELGPDHQSVAQRGLGDGLHLVGGD